MALGPDNGSKRPSGGPNRAHNRPRRINRRRLWRFLTSRCVSFWKLACTSAIRPTAGTRRWARYIFGTRNNIHIVDLAQTVPMLHRALQAVSDTVAKGGRILFVGTKRQAQDAIADAAKRCGAVLRQFALARRHADQLEDHFRFDLAPAQARRDAQFRRCRRLHQERAPHDAARARQARSLARRHQGHGRRARPAVRDRHQQGRHRDQGSAAAQHSGRGRRRHQLRSGRHHLRRCRATTTPAARCRSIAISSPRPRSMEFRARKAKWASTSARRKSRSSSKTMPTAPAAGDLGFEQLPGPRGVADDLKKLPGVSPAIEKQLNDLGIFHFSQIAELNEKAAHNIGEEVGSSRPRRWLDREGERTDGGNRISTSSWPASSRPPTIRLAKQ